MCSIVSDIEYVKLVKVKYIHLYVLWEYGICVH
jgi:hypothetical protein